ncbi:MAG: prenyltransferase [Geobacter sp.]|nr:MAG: prenyltransferase [Geobacter sp.]
MGIAESVKGYLELCRISNLPSIWTNVLCAVVLATGRFSWEAYLLPALSLSCYYLAGMCLNDVCDAAYDGLHRPLRPIPSGRVSRIGARILIFALFATGTAAILGVPFRQGSYAALPLIVLIVWYDFAHKNNPFSVLLMASCRFLVFAVAALATTGSMPALVLLAGLLQFIYVVCLSLVARYENNRTTPFPLPVIPLMLAGIPLLDGIMLAFLVQPAWLVAGGGGALLMLAGQKYFRGD